MSTVDADATFGAPRQHDALSRTMALARPRDVSPLVRELEVALLTAKMFAGEPPHVGRFQILRKIGEGGMGVVFEGLDPTLQRRVAIKVLHGADADVLLPAILQEARALARISHPNVVTVFELGSEGEDLYVVMEYVDGGHLGAWLDAHPETTWRTLASIFLGAARGLAAVHGAGLVHRDLKLENLLVSREGTPRVTDFGLSKVVADLEAAGASRAGASLRVRSRPPQARAATPAGLSVSRRQSPPASSSTSDLRPLLDVDTPGYAGTPGYVAPEVERGGAATAKSDQWSFFVCLERAFARLELTLPEALHELVRRGRSDDPNRRFEDMAAVVVRLETILAQAFDEAQRAREVLCERVDTLWLAPNRTLLGPTGDAEMPVRWARVAEYLPAERAPTTLGASPESIAVAVATLRCTALLVGGAGSGKSVHLRKIAERLLAAARASDATPLPVLLNLSSFTAHEGSLEQWLEDEVVSKYAMQRRQVQSWIAEGRLALLLDGLDEVDVARRRPLLQSLANLRRRLPVPVVLTCREDAYAPLHGPFPWDVAYRVLPLDVTAVRRYLVAHPGFGAARTAAIEAREPGVIAQLDSPLMLSFFLRLADDVQSSHETVEPLRERLFRAALDHALAHHRLPGRTTRESHEAGLRWLAKAMAEAGTSELWLESIHLGWLPRWSQRAAAAGLATATMFALSFSISLAATKVSGQPVETGLFFGFIAAAAAVVFNGGYRVRPMEAMYWSWPRFARWIPINVALGLLTGALYGLIHDFWANLVLGLATGILSLAVVGLEPSARERRIRPNEGMGESLRNSLVVAPIVGGLTGWGVGYVVLPFVRPLATPDSMYFTHPNLEFAWAVTIGASASLSCLFIAGAMAPLLHGCIRLLLAASTPLPLRLVPWLDDWGRRGMLTRVGGAWAFRHETLRAWLARHEA